MSQVVLAQLYALRAQVEALIVTVEAGLTPAVQPSPGCPHPEEKQRDATVAGGPRRKLCLLCNTEYDA